MRHYKVTITETLEMAVEVEAENAEQARDIVERQWKNGDYILDTDHFTGVDFKTVPPQRQRDMER